MVNQYTKGQPPKPESKAATRSSASSKLQPVRWPEGLTFDEACEYVGISDVEGRKRGLNKLWRSKGISFYLPGSMHPKWSRRGLDAWIDELRNGGHSGSLHPEHIY